MLITEMLWQKIRTQFTEEEKTQMNDAFCGQVICPRGVILDEAALSAELLEKLKNAKQKASQT